MMWGMHAYMHLKSVTKDIYKFMYYVISTTVGSMRLDLAGMNEISHIYMHLHHMRDNHRFWKIFIHCIVEIFFTA